MGFVPNFGGVDLMGAYFRSQAQKIRRKRKRSTRRVKRTGYAGTKRRKYGTRKAYGYATTSRRGLRKSLRSQVRTLTKKTNESLSTLISRAIGAQKLQSGVNSQASAIFDLCKIESLEGVLANCKFYDPSNPGTLITADLSTGSYSRKVTFKSCHLRLDIRSSYQVPMEIRCYLAEALDDTDLTPSQAWSAAVGDSSNLTSITQPYTYPSDCIGKSIWKYKLLKKCELKPGQHTTVSHSVGSFNYDPSLFDNHALSHQRMVGKGATLLVVVNSVLAHDTAVDQQGLGAGAVDIQSRSRYVVEYNSGGPPVKYLFQYNGMDNTFTNGAVVGNMVTDNQAFSAA